MKRIIAIAAALCFLTAGCGNIDPLTDENELPAISEETTDETASEETEETKDTSDGTENDDYDILKDPRFIEISPETEIYKQTETTVDENGELYSTRVTYYNKYDDPLHEETYYKNSDSTDTSEYTYTYDDNGNYTYCRNEYHYDDYTTFYESKYEYFEGTDEIKFIESKAEGDVYQTVSYELDENGNKKKMISTSYPEDDPDNASDTKTEYYEYSHDENDNLLHMVIKDEEDNIDSEWNYKYNEKGSCISKTYTAFTYNETTDTEFIYDELGLCVCINEKTTGIDDGELISESVSTFEYDPVTHFKQYKESVSNDYKYGYDSVIRNYYDEDGDLCRNEYDANGDGFSAKTKSVTEKEYLVSDDIAELFRSYIRMQNAKKVSELFDDNDEDTSEQAETEEMTEATEPAETEITTETTTTTETTAVTEESTSETEETTVSETSITSVTSVTTTK